MKKVVCPACGLVNLEKFITFPHCAGCGAPLGNAVADRTPVWKRPVNSLLWATILGICCAGLGIAGILTARETRRFEEKTLVVYPQIPRRLSMEQVGTVRLGLDSVEANAVTDPNFDNVQLRFPLALLERFVIISIFPIPRQKIVRGNGLYYSLERVTHDQGLTIKLKPRRAGNHRFAFSLGVAGYSNYEWRGTLPVEQGAKFSRQGRAISSPARQTSP